MNKIFSLPMTPLNCNNFPPALPKKKGNGLATLPDEIDRFHPGNRRIRYDQKDHLFQYLQRRTDAPAGPARLRSRMQMCMSQMRYPGSDAHQRAPRITRSAGRDVPENESLSREGVLARARLRPSRSFPGARLFRDRC
jgi:hypothetical protein